MPYKVFKAGERYCLHKMNPDGSRGRRMGCHDTPKEARAQQSALYANEEHTMSKAKRIKERDRRERLRLRQKEQEAERELENLEDEELEKLEVSEPETEPESVGKAYDDYAEASEMSMHYGPTTFEELDQMRAAQHKAGMISQVSYDVQDLVYNIIRNPMHQGEEKANLIKKAGDDFGVKVKEIMDTPDDMLKESDPDLLEVEAILAHDERNKTILEKAFGFMQKRELSSGARNNLSDSDFALPEKRKYPIMDKAHVRNALARAAQQIKAGGEAAADAKKALPRIRAAAKKFGIEASMEKEHTGIVIQKDANGDWRWVGWPSNNFKDRSEDILSEKAHKEYVDWWNKDKPAFPVFTSLHAPGTARTYPVDFVGYENGFLVMSGKLTEAEAVRLLEVQKEYDLGMSHTGWGVRSSADPRVIDMYRIVEVTDLPIDMADNPFTDLSVMTKEADMKQEEQLAYLTKLLGDENRAKEALLSKTSLKQKELQEAGVEQKEAPAAETPAVEPARLDMAAIVEAVGKEFDIEGLNQFVSTAQEAVEKVALLEGVIEKQQETIQKLSGDQEDKLVEMITPPAARFAWSQKARASQSDKTVVEGEEKENLQKKQAGIPDDDEYWLSHITGTTPVVQ